MALSLMQDFFQLIHVTGVKRKMLQLRNQFSWLAW